MNCKEINKPELYENIAFLKSKGFIFKKIIGDGNCQYRAVSDQIFDTEDNYLKVKESMYNNLKLLLYRVANEMNININDNDILKSPEYYMNPMVWGDNFTLQAIANTYTNYCIKVYYICEENTKILSTKYVYPEDKTKCESLKEINLYLQGEKHYSSLRKIKPYIKENQFVDFKLPEEIRSFIPETKLIDIETELNTYIPSQVNIPQSLRPKYEMYLNRYNTMDANMEDPYNQMYNPVNQQMYNPVNQQIYNTVNQQMYNPVNQQMYNPVNQQMHNPVNQQMHNPVNQQMYNPVNQQMYAPLQRWYEKMEIDMKSNSSNSSNSNSSNSATHSDQLDIDYVLEECNNKIYNILRDLNFPMYNKIYTHNDKILYDNGNVITVDDLNYQFAQLLRFCPKNWYDINYMCELNKIIRLLHNLGYNMTGLKSIYIRDTVIKVIYNNDKKEKIPLKNVYKKFYNIIKICK